MSLELDQHRSVGLTVTVGMARVRSGDSLDTALKRAADAWLQGKGQGRDRCILARP